MFTVSTSKEAFRKLHHCVELTTVLASGLSLSLLHMVTPALVVLI